MAIFSFQLEQNYAQFQVVAKKSPETSLFVYSNLGLYAIHASLRLYTRVRINPFNFKILQFGNVIL